MAIKTTRYYDDIIIFSKKSKNIACKPNDSEQFKY